jgi:hypothetical protein
VSRRLALASGAFGGISTALASIFVLQRDLRVSAPAGALAAVLLGALVFLALLTIARAHSVLGFRLPL